MEEVVNKLKLYVERLLPGEDYSVVTGSFGRVKFAAVVKKNLLTKCQNRKTGRYEMELCEIQGILIVLGDEVVVDKRQILGVGNRLLKKETKCTCGAWSIKCNFHSDWCDISKLKDETPW